MYFMKKKKNNNMYTQ